MAVVENYRIIQKRSTTSSEVPTVPASDDHSDGSWSTTDIYKGEIFVNLADNIIWFRGDDGIIKLARDSDKLNLSGGIMTGDLNMGTNNITDVVGLELENNGTITNEAGNITVTFGISGELSAAVGGNVIINSVGYWDVTGSYFNFASTGGDMGFTSVGAMGFEAPNGYGFNVGGNPAFVVDSSDVVVNKNFKVLLGSFNGVFAGANTAERTYTFPDESGTVAFKSYVDNLYSGIKWKSPVKVATTANITLSGEQTIDGVLTSVSRVLVKNQSTASENGIFVTGPGAWTRATDADSASELEGAAVLVQEGTTNGDKMFTQTSDNITLGSTNIVWTQFSSLGGSSFADNAFSVYDNSDSTKIINFELSGLTTSTTRTVTFPDKNITFAGINNETFTGQTTFAGGSSTTPGITFTGAGTNTGIYSIAANAMRFVSNGTDALVVGGNVNVLANLIAASTATFQAAANFNTTITLLDTTYKTALDVSAATSLRVGNGFSSIVTPVTTFTMNGANATINASVGNLNLTAVGSALLASSVGGNPVTIRTIGDANANTGVNLTLSGNATNGSTNRAIVTVSGTYAPTSGTTANFRGIHVSSTINETSTAANITALVDIVPTVTSVRGTLYGLRSQIAASPTGGGTAWNIYADGTAPNKFGGYVEFDSYIKLKSYTVATVPSASTAGAGAEIFVTDESGGAVPAFSDGTNWRRVTDRNIIS
jgi:hypothetical protein